MDEQIIQRAIRRVAEQRIREAMDQGAFDGLTGAGKPLPEIDASDDQWWTREWLRRNGMQRGVAPMATPDEKRARAIASIEALRDERDPPADRARPRNPNQ